VIGLEGVKEVVNELFGRAKANYHGELQGEEPIQTTMNHIFLGPPRTGKTTVSKLYGQILVDLSLVSNRDVVIKNPSDYLPTSLEVISNSRRRLKSWMPRKEKSSLVMTHICSTTETEMGRVIALMFSGSPLSTLS
jgi:broad-specificity NMP kinase